MRVASPFSGGVKRHLHPQKQRHPWYLALWNTSNKQNYTKGSRANDAARSRIESTITILGEKIENLTNVKQGHVLLMKSDLRILDMNDAWDEIQTHWLHGPAEGKQTEEPHHTEVPLGYPSSNWSALCLKLIILFHLPEKKVFPVPVLWLSPVSILSPQNWPPRSYLSHFVACIILNTL